MIFPVGRDTLTAEARAVFDEEIPKIREALRRMMHACNRKATPCGHCHLKVAENFADYEAGRLIEGFLSKLSRFAHDHPVNRSTR